MEKPKGSLCAEEEVSQNQKWPSCTTGGEVGLYGCVVLFGPTHTGENVSETAISPLISQHVTH